MKATQRLEKFKYHPKIMMRLELTLKPFLERSLWIPFVEKLPLGAFPLFLISFESYKPLFLNLLVAISSQISFTVHVSKHSQPFPGI